MSDDKLNLILQELQGVKQELQGMKQEQQGIKQELQEMKHTFTEKFVIVEKKIDAVHEQVAKNTENIAVMQGDISHLKKVQETMVSIQGRQEKTIDLLARRSIDQEAELKSVR